MLFRMHIFTDVFIESRPKHETNDPTKISRLRFVKTSGSGGMAVAADKG